MKALNEVIEKLHVLVGKNEKQMPIVFIAIVGTLLLLSGAPIGALIFLAVFFAAGYVLLKVVFGLDELQSTVAALPVSIIAASVLFRIGLLFGREYIFGIVSLLLGTGAIIIFSTRLKEENTWIIFRERQDQSEKTDTWLKIFAVLFLAIVGSNLIYGQIKQGQTIWGSNDANWQTTMIDHLKAGTFSMDPNDCQGKNYYDIDSYSSTISLLPPYFMAMLGGLSGSITQQIMTHLGFLIMLVNLYLLYDKYFSNSWIFATILVVLPLAMQPYLPEFFGIWRGTLFNYFFPFALLLTLNGFKNKLNCLLLGLSLMFVTTTQPFSSLLLLPPLAILTIKDIGSWKNILIIGILVGVFFYFGTIQIVFNTIGNSGQGYKLDISLDNIQRTESDNLLVGKLKISLENLGRHVLIIAGLCLVFLAFKAYEEYTRNGNYEMAILFISVLFGIILASGIVSFGESFYQYVQKVRYNVLMIFVFPIAGLLLGQVYKNNHKAAYVLGLVLLAIAIENYNALAAFHSKDIDPREGVVNWLATHAESDEYTLYFKEIFSQQAELHIPTRHIGIEAQKIDTRTMSFDNLLASEDLLACTWRRDGPLQVRKEALVAQKVSPDYIVSLNPASTHGVVSLNKIISSNGYDVVYTDRVFIIYQKNLG
jgi:hypothetical protein